MTGFRHVVMFKWNDTVDDAHVAWVTEGLATLPGIIPQIVEYHVGADAGINDGNFDYAVVADFASIDDYLVYRDDPDHQALIAERIAGRVDTRAAVQYPLDH